MSLTDASIRTAKPADKPRKMTDSNGLYLIVTPSGGKWWRYKYRHGNREKLLAIGTYPGTSLREARERRDEARKMLTSGVDPGAARKARKSAVKAEKARDEETFGKVAWEWFNAWKEDKAASNVKRVRERLVGDVLPWLGEKPVAEVKEYDVFATCDRIQQRGAIETAHRVMGYLDAIFAYVISADAKDRAISDGKKQKRIESNPCKDLRGRNVQLLQPAPPQRHFAHFKDEQTGGVSTARLGEFLRATDAFSGSLQVLAALRLTPMLFVRPGEMRRARWCDVDLDRQMWCFTISKRMPGEEARQLVVPLPRQATAILSDLRPLTGDGEYVFPGGWDKHKPMSEAAVNAAIRRLGFSTQEDVSAHGFRHVASTLLNEQGYPSDAIEKSLGHSIRGIRGVYDHAQYLKERLPMAQSWADYLDRLKAGAEIIPLRGTAA